MLGKPHFCHNLGLLAIIHCYHSMKFKKANEPNLRNSKALNLRPDFGRIGPNLPPAPTFFPGF